MLKSLVTPNIPFSKQFHLHLLTIFLVLLKLRVRSDATAMGCCGMGFLPVGSWSMVIFQHYLIYVK